MSEPSDFIRWGSIEGLHHIRSHLEKERDKTTGELFAPYSIINAYNMTLRYRSKVKLHGMNCGIVINQGEIKLQSRNMFMDGSVQGNKQKGKFFGFDAWALKQKDFFLSLEEPIRKQLKLADDALITLFGEWCGPAVQKGVALSKLKKPIFAIFAVRVNTNLLVVEPEAIQKLLALSSKPLPADLHVLPWHEDYRMPEQSHREITLKFDDETSLEARAVIIQSMVVDVDREDPWVRRQFDVSGVGEGLVFYPMNLIGDDGYITSEAFEAFSFKAKGAAHQMTSGAHSKGIQLKTLTAASPQEFADMFLTTGRFSQGVTEITLGDMSALEKSKFIDWVVNDVKKESKIELEDSKLNWNDVEPLIRNKADAWFNENIKLSTHAKKTYSLTKSSYVAPSFSSYSSLRLSTTVMMTAPQLQSTLFENTKVFISERVPYKQKSQLTKLIKEHSGTIIFMFSPANCTHVVEVEGSLSSSRLDKLASFSKKSKTPVTLPFVVKDSYFHDSAAQNQLLAEEKYQLWVLDKGTVTTSVAETKKAEEEAPTTPDPEDGNIVINLEEGETIPKIFVWSYGQKREPIFPSNFTVIKFTMLHAMDFENNNNKFYYMEIQQAPSDFEGTFKYRVFTHHGRTDELEVKSKNIGQKQCRYCFNEREAQLIYLSILKDKTSEEKGYKTIHLLSISNKIGLKSISESATVKVSSSDTSPEQSSNAESQLSAQLQTLIKVLYDEASDALKSELLAQVTNKGLETPLGILALKQIEKGEEVLMRLYQLFKEGNTDEQQLLKLSSHFYSLIPHRLGTKKTDVQKALINSTELFEEKQNLLQLMKDIIKVQQKRGKQLDTNRAEIDRKYDALDCDIKLLDKSSFEFAELKNKLIQSKPQNKEDEAPNKFEVFNIFSVNRLEEEQNFARQMSNQKLLVHGSRVANYVGLLSRGILLPKIVVSRGMASRTDFGYLGSGVYFSDNLYASVKYAAPSKNGARFALMTLVSLGRAKEFTKITPNLEKAPEGFESCLGLAQTSQKSSDFLNNEYVVYDASQYKNQYLVEFKLL